MSSSTIAHILPQVFHLGNNYNYYDYVIDTEKINEQLKPLLEDIFKTSLPFFQGRKQNLTKIQLTSSQDSMERDIYKDDYIAGWK